MYTYDRFFHIHIYIYTYGFAQAPYGASEAAQSTVRSSTVTPKERQAQSKRAHSGHSARNSTASKTIQQLPCFGKPEPKSKRSFPNPHPYP